MDHQAPLKLAVFLRATQVEDSLRKEQKDNQSLRSDLKRANSQIDELKKSARVREKVVCRSEVDGFVELDFVLMSRRALLLFKLKLALSESENIRERQKIYIAELKSQLTCELMNISTARSDSIEEEMMDAVRKSV
eukprot:768656-Hanusia_phi.AAC.2